MRKSDLKKYYSCKRKKDWVTFFAVFMFILMIVQELYLVIVVPIELKKRSALNKQVAKLEMIAHLDRLRPKVKNARAVDNVQFSERELCKEILDSYAVYLRENESNLTMEDIVQLKKILDRYESIYGRWYGKPPKYYLKRKKMDVQPAITAMEQKITQKK